MSMILENLFLESTVVTVSYLVHYDTFFYKMRHLLIQNVTVTLLPNPTKVYYKMRQIFYCKM